jgi:hypothetical protein
MSIWCQTRDVLPDGDHDAIVVDADDEGDGRILLSLTLLAGEHKGRVVEVHASNLGRDALDLLAEPCTIHVRDGEPTVTLG